MLESIKQHLSYFYNTMPTKFELLFSISPSYVQNIWYLINGVYLLLNGIGYIIF